MVGHEDGTVAFWSAKKGTSIYVLKAHSNDITKLQWVEKDNILLTSSKEKSIKFWSLPKEWRDKKIEAIEEREAELQRKKENIAKVEQI